MQVRAEGELAIIYSWSTTDVVVDLKTNVANASLADIRKSMRTQDRLFKEGELEIDALDETSSCFFSQRYLSRCFGCSTHAHYGGHRSGHCEKDED